MPQRSSVMTTTAFLMPIGNNRDSKRRKEEVRIYFYYAIFYSSSLLLIYSLAPFTTCDCLDNASFCVTIQSPLPHGSPSTKMRPYLTLSFCCQYQEQHNRKLGQLIAVAGLGKKEFIVVYFFGLNPELTSSLLQQN